MECGRHGSSICKCLLFQAAWHAWTVRMSAEGGRQSLGTVAVLFSPTWLKSLQFASLSSYSSSFSFRRCGTAPHTSTLFHKFVAFLFCSLNVAAASDKSSLELMGIRSQPLSEGKRSFLSFSKILTAQNRCVIASCCAVYYTAPSGMPNCVRRTTAPGFDVQLRRGFCPSFKTRTP